MITITSLPELYFRFRTHSVDTNKKVISMKYGSSTSSIEFKDILLKNISQMIAKTVPISMRIGISYVMKWGIPFWVWQKIHGNWDTNMIRISQWRESHCRTNTSTDEINPKRAGLWGSQSGMRVRKLAIWVKWSEIITEFTRSIPSTRIG